MSNHQNGTARHGTARHHQQGFTLVEIGVVLVIIGLLLGAVLKGQELIASARVSNLVQNMNGYKAAINGFQDRYRMMPGDSSTAATKVGNGAVNCSATSTCDDGVLSAWQNVSLVNNHLSAAGFYSGPTLTAEATTQPTATGYLNNPGGGPIYLHTGTNYLAATGAAGGSATGVFTGWSLSSKLLAEVDRKMDDGNGWTGGLRASSLGVGTGCLDAAGLWVQTAPGTNCGAMDLF